MPGHALSRVERGGQERVERIGGLGAEPGRPCGDTHATRPSKLGVEPEGPARVSLRSHRIEGAGSFCKPGIPGLPQGCNQRAGTRLGQRSRSSSSSPKIGVFRAWRVPDRPPAAAGLADHESNPAPQDDWSIEPVDAGGTGTLATRSARMIHETARCDLRQQDQHVTGANVRPRSSRPASIHARMSGRSCGPESQPAFPWYRAGRPRPRASVSLGGRHQVPELDRAKVIRAGGFVRWGGSPQNRQSMPAHGNGKHLVDEVDDRPASSGTTR